jgi:hypothetical protein
MRMRRVALLALIALPVFGLTPLERGNRIGVLQMADDFAGPERVVARTIGVDLTTELTARGFNAFQAKATYEDAQRGGAPGADYYVEVVSSRTAQRQTAGIGAGVGPVGVEVGVVVAHVAAEVRLYDGRTFALLETYDLRQRNTAVAPTAVGLGTRSVWASVMLPFVQYGQYRSAAHAVAREAAARIASR